MLLTEFDPNQKAIINAGDGATQIEGFPDTVVTCFAYQTFEMILDQYEHEEIHRLTIANLSVPVYKINYNGKDIALFNSYVGAAGCVGLLEDMAFQGMKKLVIFGTCGVLDKSIKDTSIIIPHTALRDEGTSFHYAPASHEIRVNEKYRDDFVALLNELDTGYTEGKVWTTDAFYRETAEKMKRRKEAGAVCVDMECSAVAAFAQFRNIDVMHFFYSADNLDGENWDSRSLSNSHKLDEKHKISSIALEFAYRMK